MTNKLLIIMLVSMFVGLTNSAHAVLIGADNGDLYDHDVGSNTSTLIGNSGMAMFDIALDPLTNILYGISGSRDLYTIDQNNASLTFVGNAGSFINGLTFDSAGTLFGTGGTGLYSLDLVSGAATTIGSTGFNSSGDIAFDSSGNLYLSATGSGGDQLVSLDSTTGVGTAIGNMGFSSVYGLNFSGSTLFGFTSGGLTLSIDTGTGVSTQIATNSIAAYGADGVGGVLAVSEPGTIVLLGLGVFGLGLSRKRIMRS